MHFDKMKGLEIKFIKLEIDGSIFDLLRSIYKRNKKYRQHLVQDKIFERFIFWTEEKENNSTINFTGC